MTLTCENQMIAWNKIIVPEKKNIIPRHKLKKILISLTFLYDITTSHNI
jgi:hypothetical protein